jgi:hypothetical protein
MGTVPEAKWRKVRVFYHSPNVTPPHAEPLSDSPRQNGNPFGVVDLPNELIDPYSRLNVAPGANRQHLQALSGFDLTARNHDQAPIGAPPEV